MFIEDLGSFRFFYGDVSIGWCERLEIIVVIPWIFDVLIDLKRRDFNVLLITLQFGHHSFGSELLVLSWRNRNILDDGDI